MWQPAVAVVGVQLSSPTSGVAGHSLEQPPGPPPLLPNRSPNPALSPEESLQCQHCLLLLSSIMHPQYKVLPILARTALVAPHTHAHVYSSLSRNVNIKSTCANCQRVPTGRQAVQRGTQKHLGRSLASYERTRWPSTQFPLVRSKKVAQPVQCQG